MIFIDLDEIDHISSLEDTDNGAITHNLFFHGALIQVLIDIDGKIEIKENKIRLRGDDGLEIEDDDIADVHSGKIEATTRLECDYHITVYDPFREPFTSLLDYCDGFSRDLYSTSEVDEIKDGVIKDYLAFLTNYAESLDEDFEDGVLGEEIDAYDNTEKEYGNPDTGFSWAYHINKNLGYPELVVVHFDYWLDKRMLPEMEKGVKNDWAGYPIQEWMKEIYFLPENYELVHQHGSVFQLFFEGEPVDDIMEIIEVLEANEGELTYDFDLQNFNDSFNVECGDEIASTQFGNQEIYMDYLLGHYGEGEM